AVDERVKDFMLFFLLLEVGMNGVFLAQDLFLFYIFWEFTLVPMYFLIGIWGGPRRIYAAIKFFLFTLAGSVALLLGILALYWKTGLNTFDIVQLAVAARALPLAVQAPIFFAFFFGFAVKVPIVPLHTWLPDAHVEAPTPISVILAGVLLKTGGYGFYRFVYSTFPDAVKEYAILIAVIGVVSIVYGALVAMAQQDLKTLIALASVSHMGYVLFGLATMKPEGFSAGMFQMVSHGFVSASLFLLVGVIYDRTHTRGVNEFGGLGAILPAYFAFFTLAGLANLALPGLSGFWGEVLAYMGAFRNYDYVWNGMFTFRLLAFLAAPAIVVTAGYTLWTIQRIFMGPLNEAWKNLPDINWREKWSLAIPAVFIVAFGLMPSLLTNIYNNSMNILLGVFGR
ncbi:MAG: complex I subunit 4 family protein, partial [bacterium]